MGGLSRCAALARSPVPSLHAGQGAGKSSRQVSKASPRDNHSQGDQGTEQVCQAPRATQRTSVRGRAAACDASLPVTWLEGAYPAARGLHSPAAQTHPQRVGRAGCRPPHCPPLPPELPPGEPAPSCACQAPAWPLASEFILEEQLHSEAQPPSWGVRRSPLCPLGTGVSWHPSAGLAEASCRHPGAWTLLVRLHAHLHTCTLPFPRTMTSVLLSFRDWSGAAGNLKEPRLEQEPFSWPVLITVLT